MARHDDDDDDIEVPGLGRPRRSRVTTERVRPAGSGPGYGAVVVVSALTAAAVSAGVFFALRSAVPPSAAVVAASAVAATATAATPSAAEAPSASAAPAAPPSAPASAVTVPNLVRVPLENAQSIAAALGLTLAVRERRADPTAPAESIAAQAPLAGAQLARGGAIEVHVSTGPSTAAVAAPSAALASAALTAAAEPSAPAAGSVAVPRLVGQRLPRAMALLQQAGLRLGHRSERFDEDRGPYVVLRQSVPAGQAVTPGTAIDLVVNQGE